jgi:hypothetical protein
VREPDLYFDGVRLAPVSPFAWAATVVLTVCVHAMAGTGFSLHSPQLQSTALVTIFVGGLAIVGTMQKMNQLRGRGRRGSAAALVMSFLVLSVAITCYGFTAYI